MFMRHAWPVPNGVNIAFTTRQGGYSQGVFNGLNLGLHVEDKPEDVLANRNLVSAKLNLPNAPAWLEQIHSTQVVDADNRSVMVADGSYTRNTDSVCVVMTADCLPVLLCDKQASEIAAVHAGWKGLAHGVIESAVAKFIAPHSDIIAFLGPAIGSDVFEVGAEVRAEFIKQQQGVEYCFIAAGDGKYLANLEKLATARLNRMGITTIYAANQCTFSQPQHYFSYRRDGKTGRMASYIWLS